MAIVIAEDVRPHELEQVLNLVDIPATAVVVLDDPAWERARATLLSVLAGKLRSIEQPPGRLSLALAGGPAATAATAHLWFDGIRLLARLPTGVDLALGRAEVVERTASYQVSPLHHSEWHLVTVAGIAITTDTADNLGEGFQLTIINDSDGAVTIDGPSADLTLNPGDIGTIRSVNGKVRAGKGSSILL